MKHLFPCIWNILLIGILWADLRYRLPRLVGQFSDIPWEMDADFVSLTLAIGFVDLGAAIFEILLAISLSSWGWKVFSKRTRYIYAASAIALILGTVVCIAVWYWNFGRVSSISDFITFAISVPLVVFPIVVFGTGYPGLIKRRWVRSKT